MQACKYDFWLVPFIIAFALSQSFVCLLDPVGPGVWIGL